jgi:hypothetical protein
VNLYFSQTLKLLLNESTIPVTAVSTLIDEIEDVQISSTSCMNPQYIDYIYRNASFEAECYYDFIRKYVKSKSSEGFPFMNAHVQFNTHSIFEVKGTLPIPVVFSSRLPNINGKNLSDDEKLMFYQIMLVLFKPFRSLGDLVPSNTLENWKRTYDDWDQDEIAKNFLKFNLDYYESSRSSETQVDPGMEYFHSFLKLMKIQVMKKNLRILMI